MMSISQFNAVSVFRLHHTLKSKRALQRKLGTVNDETYLGVQPPRSLIEIHRAHEYLVAIENDNFRVQRVVAIARDALGLPAATRIAKERACLVQIDTLHQERDTKFHVARLCNEFRRRLKRVGQYPYVDAPCP